MRKFVLPALLIAALSIGCSSDDSTQETTAMNEDFVAKTTGCAQASGTYGINPEVGMIGNNLVFVWSGNFLRKIGYTYTSKIEITDIGCINNSTVINHPIDLINTTSYSISGGIDGGTGTDNCFMWRITLDGVKSPLETCSTVTEWYTYTP